LLSSVDPIAACLLRGVLKEDDFGLPLAKLFRAAEREKKPMRVTGVLQLLNDKFGGEFELSGVQQDAGEVLRRLLHQLARESEFFDTLGKATERDWPLSTIDFDGAHSGEATPLQKMVAGVFVSSKTHECGHTTQVDAVPEAVLGLTLPLQAPGCWAALEADGDGKRVLRELEVYYEDGTPPPTINDVDYMLAKGQTHAAPLVVTSSVRGGKRPPSFVARLFHKATLEVSTDDVGGDVQLKNMEEYGVVLLPQAALPIASTSLRYPSTAPDRVPSLTLSLADCLTLLVDAKKNADEKPSCCATCGKSSSCVRRGALVGDKGPPVAYFELIRARKDGGKEALSVSVPQTLSLAPYGAAMPPTT